jgi:exonuclease SbcC
MIPVKLTLKNFMSYGEERTELNFAGMHVVSLSGDNGNGKSALLDAITYALWGKTRASGSQVSSEEDLIRLGAEDMEVTFEFLLGDDQYRVIKKRSRRTRSGDWQVHLCDPSGVWRPVGATGTRETEKVLVRILRMEYETFLNSAYIQQGHADEFTRQKPDARKRILADILDLSRYDRLEEMAKERRNEADLQLKELDGEIRLYESRAGEGEALRAKLLEQEAALLTWTTERTIREEKLNDLRKRQASLDEKAQFLQRREEMLKEAEHEVADVDAQIARLRLKIEADAGLPGAAGDTHRA